VLAVHVLPDAEYPIGEHSLSEYSLDVFQFVISSNESCQIMADKQLGLFAKKHSNQMMTINVDFTDLLFNAISNEEIIKSSIGSSPTALITS
jgi:hypothetical protein